jgi:hypothetical protein
MDHDQLCTGTAAKMVDRETPRHSRYTGANVSGDGSDFT